MIRGTTILIAHLGFPTEAFKAPMIYNPYFEQAEIDAVVIPMGVKAEDYPGVLASLFKLTNIRGALVTMPHKVTTAALVDEVTPTAKIAGACNAILRRPDGTLLGDMFDGAGFVRGIARKGFELGGRRALVVGCGGVGSAIAASLAAAGIGAIGLFDAHAASAEELGSRLRNHYPALVVTTGSNDPADFDLVVNATSMGMNEGDPTPMDVSRIAASTFVGEVVMKQEMTAFLQAAQARGCRSRWEPTCCSSRYPPTSSSSASRAPRRKSCVRSPSCAIDRATAGGRIAFTPRRSTAVGGDNHDARSSPSRYSRKGNCEVNISESISYLPPPRRRQTK